MDTEIYEDEVSVCGIPLSLEADCRVVYQDESFDHAFGTERSGHWEIEEIWGLRPTCDVRQAIIDELHARGITNHNARFRKRVRHLESAIETALDALDPEDVFSDAAKEAAEERGGVEPEPDYDFEEDYDRDYDREYVPVFAEAA